jgi:hypothetical protein
VNDYFGKRRWICAALVFLVAILVYGWTLAPTVTLVDSGELIVVAHSLGVAHPPGFPLYILLTHLASLVPVGSVARRVNFASGVFAAFACAMLTLVVKELTTTATSFERLKRKSKKVTRKPKKKSDLSIAPLSGDNLGSTGLLTIAPALGSGLLLAFSRTLWSYATIAEVYTLNALVWPFFF